MIPGIVGFGVLMALVDSESNIWIRMLIAAAAGAWLGLWLQPLAREAGPPLRAATRTSLFIMGVVGFGVLMGLRDIGPNHWVRALIAGAAGAWLALFRVIRPIRSSAKPARI